MIDLSRYHDAHIGIIGLGKTGIAAARALAESGAHLSIWDDSPDAANSLPVPLASALAHYGEWDWPQLDAVVVSPGVPLTHPAPHPAVVLAQRHHVRITSDIELLLEACHDAMRIGITGTNGKSTTTSLIAHILRHAGKRVEVGGNLGMAALGLAPLGGDDIYVLELSSYQLDLLPPMRFDVAVWLNISPDHLDRHGDLDGYIEAKKRIFAGQKKQDCAVIGIDDPHSEALCRTLIAASQQKMISIATTQRVSDGIWVKDGILHAALDGQNQQMDMQAMATLRGEHNHQNAAAAYAACLRAGLGHAEIEAGMKTYPGLAHRMQPVGQIGRVLCINDSKATNADAAAKSLGSYDRIYWIAGGVPKAGGITSLLDYFPRICKAFLIGEAAEEFARTLEGKVPYQQCGTLANAVEAAVEAVQHDSDPVAPVILLAPACASFDQFAHFEQRGERFVELVERYTGPQGKRHAI